MFGNLFEEEEGEDFSSTSSRGRGTKGGGEPPPPRGKAKLCGIKNQGGTCYLNSLLQTLLFTPEFREELFSLGSEELGCLEDKEKPEAKVRVIPLELQRLFSSLLLVDQQSASTANLTDSFGWNSSEGTNQQDVQELNRILFSALEHSLVDTSGSTLIHRLYHGTIVNSIVCRECGNVSQRQEDFLDLTVCVCGVSSLEEALWNMFVEEEMFEGNNLYRCAGCDRLVTAAKSAKLKKLPPFMTMSLLRFSFDFNKCERYKETGRYCFPLTINLRPFCEQTDGEDSDFTYELFSVIIHKGGCYGGHYHAYIRDIDQLGKWEPQKVKEACEPKLQEDDPLSVLTAIIAQEPSKSVLLDQLGQKLLDKIGSSWSKKFRKHYGPIGKFLQSHSDVFMLVSSGTRVALKANPPSPVTEPPSPAEQTPNSDPSTPSDSEAAEQTGLEQKTEPEQESCFSRCSLPVCQQGSHWFDLNDSSVTSIRDEEFEATNNTVELRLHLAPSYRLENGALQPISKEQNGSTALSFDRRKTVGDLRLAIYQMQELWEGDMALTVAKSLPAGLHLYNTLTDDGVSLYSAGISTNSDLFVWNGREDGVECVEGSGGGFENGAPGLKREARGFAGAVTLREVREALGEPKESVLCQKVFPPDDMQRTLKELSLKDGDALLVLEPQSFDCSWSCLIDVVIFLSALQLFLHFSVGAAPSAGVEMDIIVENTCTVKECLKAMLDAVGLDGCWHLRRLDWCEEVGEALMDEDASLSELKISNGDTLVVTEGQLPPKGFLKLSVWLYLDPRNNSADFKLANNEVELSDEATLEDLKTQVVVEDSVVNPEVKLKILLPLLLHQVLTLPALQHVCMPTTAFMRVWQLEGKRLARILRGQQLTLRKLKLTGGADLCIQQLLKEEDLGPKELLLNIKMGVPGERCYYPREELVWDASRDSSPHCLRTCLAAHYGLSPDSLLLAKYQQDKHTWEEISNWNQQVSKKKKKKRAESLLGAPFHLKDGDTIGIKVFTLIWEAAGCDGVGPQKKTGQTKSRKPEVALSINVGVFR
uniref:Ubiquitin specific peptidase 40 n=1 Tax=Labrus bergylta TaxID=56723 RepID=A0A3Q3G3R6_9LABR